MVATLPVQNLGLLSPRIWYYQIVSPPTCPVDPEYFGKSLYTYTVKFCMSRSWYQLQ